MVRNVAAPVNFVKRSAFLFQEIFVYEQVVFGTAFTKRVNVRMLTKNQVIGRDFFFVGSYRFAVRHFYFQGFGKQFFLKIPGFLVIYGTKREKSNVFI